MRMGRAVWLSVATMASRVLGLVRDQLFAALVGANRFSDAFVVAFRIPNLLRDLFAEGALSSAFVPTFAEVQANRGREEAWRLGNAVVGVILAVVGAAVLLGVLLAPWIVRLIAPGFEPEPSALATDLTRIMMPFLLLVSLSAAAMGMLNAQSRFAAPALAPALFNVGAIAVGVGLWVAGKGPRAAVVGWSLGTLLGGLLQLLAQLPTLWSLGYRPRPRLGRAALSDPGLRRIGRLMAPAVVGLSATQVNIVVNTLFASHEAGANTLAADGLPAHAAPARRLRRRHRHRGRRRGGAAGRRPGHGRREGHARVGDAPRRLLQRPVGRGARRARATRSSPSSTSTGASARPTPPPRPRRWCSTPSASTPTRP